MYHLAKVLPFVLLPVPAWSMEIKTVRTIDQIPTQLPAAGHYRLHFIDVGTGLSILIQGNTWNLVYVAGSNDDLAGGRNSPVTAYLYEAIGRSGDNGCRPRSATYPSRPANAPQLAITHVFQSHPHQDHGVLIDEVLDCYQVANVWDSGGINDRVFYRRLLEFLEDETGVVYHTATPPANRTLTVGSTTITLPTANWVSFSVGTTVTLDSNATFTILHAEGATQSDLNENSIVVRLDLGTHSVLLMGDAGSGDREAPSDPIGLVEADLVMNHATEINVDILQIGHHGSKTSSRTAFIDAVSPTYALISSGPKKYGTSPNRVVLTDDEIVDMLLSKGIVILRTDLYDKNCPVDDRVGRESRDGGCTNYVMDW